MVNTKKLISGFLLLSVSTSIVLFSFSGRHFSAQTAATASSKRILGQIADANGNVFLPGYTEIADASTDYQNLTATASRGLGLAVLALNPEGPDFSGGEPSLVLPDEDTLARFIALQSPAFKLADLWTNVSAADLNLLQTSSPADNRRYTDSFESLMKKTISDPQFLTALREQRDVRFITALPAVFDKAAAGLRKMAVPEPFAEFHKNFLVYVEDQRNALRASFDFSDPLKAVVARKLNGEMAKRIQGDFVAMLNEYVKLDLEKLLSLDAKTRKGFFEKIFGLFAVEKAKAISMPGIPNIPGIGGGGGGGSGLPGLGDIGIPGLSGGIPDECNPVALRAATDFLDAFGGIFSVGGLKDMLGGQIPGGIGDILGGLPGIGTIPGLSVPVSDGTVAKNTGATAKIAGTIAERAAELVYISSSMLTLMISDCVREVTGDIFKGELTQIIQAQTLIWIQNFGEPRFITNYNFYFKNAALEGANAAYQDIQPTLCPEFEELAKTFLDPGSVANESGIFSAGSTNLGNLFDISSIFSGGLGNFGFNSLLGGSVSGGGCDRNFDEQTFYDDFEAGGGFGAFVSLLKPENNLFGSLIDNSEIISKAGASAAEAAKAQSIASQGFRSDTTCAEYAEDEEGNEFCVKEEIITPGRTIAGQVGRAVEARFERVTNAQNFDIKTLIDNVANALGTKLIQEEQQGLYNLQIPAGSCFNFNPGGIGGLLSGGGLGGAFNFDLQGCTQLLQNLATDEVRNLLSGSGGGGTSTSTGTGIGTGTGSGGGISTSTTPGIGIPGGSTTCSPSNQTVEPGELATITASGGNGNYFWSATGGNPSFQTSGSSFSTSYALVGSRTVSVASNGTVANCSVTVEAPGGIGGPIIP